ncbi:hypothetical protein [Labrys neptuniae]
MAATATAMKLNAANSAPTASVKKAGVLAARAPYEAPKVLSMSVKEMSTDNALSMMGNVGDAE